MEFGTFYNKSNTYWYASRFIYSLIYFSESTPSPKNISIVNQIFIGLLKEINPKTGLFYSNFIKFIPLSEEKTIFCYNENNDNEDYKSYILYSKIKCGLAQVQNNNITINSLIYISKSIYRVLSEIYLYKKVLDGVKINDKQIILSYYDHHNLIHYIKISIINGKLSSESTNVVLSSSYNDNSPGFHSLYLLKNNDDLLVSISVFNYKASFKEYGYIACQNSEFNLYNGEKYYKINFKFNYSLFENNNIIFLNKTNQTIYSIIDGNNKTIKYLETYNKNYISYKYNPEDYDYIKNNSFKLFFTSSLNEKMSETCQINLTFNQCKKECEICTRKNCYDKNMNTVNIIVLTDLERYLFILPLSILAMLIVLIFFSFEKCCIREPLPNYGGKLIQNEMPLIQN